jgi:hypothetical protein
MVVDGYGILVDLSAMQNSSVDPASLTDPTVLVVEWGPVVSNGDAREGGRMLMQDGTVRTFSDKNLLTPYLQAYYQARKASGV